MKNNHKKIKSRWDDGVLIVLTTGCTYFISTVHFVIKIFDNQNKKLFLHIFSCRKSIIISIDNYQQSKIYGENSTKPKVSMISCKSQGLRLQTDVKIVTSLLSCWELDGNQSHQRKKNRTPNQFILYNQWKKWQ